MNFPTFIVFNLHDKLNILEFVRFIKSKYSKYEIIIASKKSHKEIDDAKEYVFDTNDEDEVLNTLIPMCNGNKLIVCRNLTNDFEVVEKLEKNLKKQNQITIIKKKRNKISNFLFNWFNKLVLLVCGYYLFDGYIANIGFEKIAIDVLQNVENCSFYSKVNKWIGCEIVRIDDIAQKNINLNCKIALNISRIILELLLIVGLVLVWIFVPFVKNNVFIKIIDVFLIAFVVCLIVLESVVLFVKIKVGKSTLKKAKILNN